jgi:hypothetical protein
MQVQEQGKFDQLEIGKGNRSQAATLMQSKVFIDMRRRFFVFIRNFKHSRTGIVNSLQWDLASMVRSAPKPCITGKNE